MNEPLISVVVVNWNGEKWLGKCLDSLSTQTYGNYEVVLVDNHSTDGSVEFVKKNYASEKIRIIQTKENLGFAGGNNIGINASNGEHILLLNNDTWVDASFLAGILDFFQRNDFDVVAPTETDYENTVRNNRAMKIDLLGHPIYIDNNHSQVGFYLHGVCLFFKKDFYLQTQGLDNDFFMYFEEVDWFWRLNLLGKKFSFIPGVFVHHAGAGSTGSGIKYQSFLWRNQNCLQMILKNYAGHNLFWILPLYVLQNLIEIFFFLVILKPKISISYVEGWWFNIRNLGKTWRKRTWVQQHRVLADTDLMRRNFYFGFAKIHHLLNFKNTTK